MAQSHKTQMLSGYFDCRVFRNGVAKESRPMKQDGETISFSVGFSEYPDAFKVDGGDEFIKETIVNDAKRWYVTFKVGKICAFFDRNGQRAERPTNEMLDGKRWDVCLQYKVLHGDAAKLQPRGFWADAIQLKPADEISFEPMEGATPEKAVTTDEPAPDVAGDEPPF